MIEYHTQPMSLPSGLCIQVKNEVACADSRKEVFLGKKCFALGLFLLCMAFPPLSRAVEIQTRELTWDAGFSSADFVAVAEGGGSVYETWKLSPYGGSLTVSARLPNQSFGWWAPPHISVSRYKDGQLLPVASAVLEEGGVLPRDLILPPTTFDYDLMNDACAAFVISFYPSSSCWLYWCNYIEAAIQVKRPGTCTVQFELTYPVGESPKVFTDGWTFGARAIRALPDGSYEDLSPQVKWSGTGKFYPETGSRSSPVFNGEGANTITLSLDAGSGYTRDFSVNAVSPQGYARLSDHAFVPADTHGAIGDPHPAAGPITGGSPNVLIKGLPAARAGDPGVHMTCSGPNIFVIQSGDPSVLIDGRPAARIGDPTQHCGGMGSIIGPKRKAPTTTAAREALALSTPEAATMPLAASGSLSGRVFDGSMIPIEGLRVWLFGTAGMDPAVAQTDGAGTYAFNGLADGSYRVYFSNVSIRTVEGQVQVTAEPYAPAWYYLKPSYSEAALVTVTADSPAVNIDTQLYAAGSITGLVTDGSGTPLEKVRVTAYSDAFSGLSWSWTGADGRYEVGGLPDGNYRLWFEDSASLVIPLWYPASLTREGAQTVTVSNAGRSTVGDVVLSRGGTISGSVTDRRTGNSLQGVTVQAVALASGAGSLAETAADGTYRITGLADGSYKVRFIAGNQGYAGLWHTAARNWDSAASVTIASAAEVANIDATLEGMTLADLLSLLQIVSGMMPAEPFFHIQDLDGDGRIGLPEAIYILQKASDIRP